MPLFATHWNNNVRVRAAAINAPSMAAFERDAEAVRLLQKALAVTGIMPTIKVDGIYGPETAGAVVAVERRFNLSPDQGVAGREVLGVLDLMLRNVPFGAELARMDVPLATYKVRRGLMAIETLQAGGGGVDGRVATEALRTHFRLVAGGGAAFGFARAVRPGDLELIATRYSQLLGLLASAAERFRTGAPVNGITTAAEAPLNGPITFGPAFTCDANNFGDPTGAKIGDNSRAAILIHEGVHVFDKESGDGHAHISEFDPAYDTQSADHSLHNPSSYAGFAAHVYNGSDPQPRYGLGAGQPL